MALWGAFVLTTPTGTIYHVGDSGYGDGALFGAYAPRWFMADQHMNPARGGAGDACVRRRPATRPPHTQRPTNA